MADGARGRAMQVARSGARITVRAGALLTAPWRGSPDFLLIGTKRGGTTSLYRQLETHDAYLPLFPSAARLPMRENMKGVHFFDTHHHYGRAWYRSHFPSRRARAARVAAVGAAFTGDASPYYLFHPLAAERAAAAVPDAKLVVLLRDPIERTISHWAEQTRNGVETLSLADALAAEPTRLGDSGAHLASGRVRTSFAHEQQSYASQSEYAASLERWIRHFGRERLLVLFSEDYYADPLVALRQVTDFLGVAPHGEVDLSVRNAAQRTGVAADDGAVRAALAQRFAPDVAALEALVGRRPPWPWAAGAAAD
jgi:hypothetical protein